MLAWLWKNLASVGDIFAIPLFFLQILYFGSIKQKTLVEWILFAFGVTGFAADALFTTRFLLGE